MIGHIGHLSDTGSLLLIGGEKEPYRFVFDFGTLGKQSLLSAQKRTYRLLFMPPKSRHVGEHCWRVRMDRRGWSGMIALIAAGAAWGPAMGTDSNATMQALAAQVVVASGNDARISAINRAYLERDKLKAALTTALPKDVSEQTISAAVETEIQFEAEAFFEENVRIYSTHFSEAELQDMLAFYQSPGGKALVAQTPKIIQEKAAFGQQLGRDLVSRMVVSACGGKSACH